MEHVVFGGVDLSKRFTCLVKSRPMPSFNPRTQQVSGSDRYTPMGAEILPEQITVRLVCGYAPEDERREIARWLGGVLYSKEPKRLSLSSDRGLWHTATLAKGADFRELVSTGYVEVTFQPMESWLYGEEHSVTVPSGGSASFKSDGSYPTAPKIVAASASGTTWGLRLDDGDFVHVPLSSTSRVEIDCDKRTCLVGNSVSVPTLDSDWLQFSAGSHTIRNDIGSGACVVMWIDRWL